MSFTELSSCVLDAKFVPHTFRSHRSRIGKLLNGNAIIFQREISVRAKFRSKCTC